MHTAISRVKAAATAAEHYERLRSARGLSTNIIHTDEENAERILSILKTYLDGKPMEFANRSEGNWQEVFYLPNNFNEFRYRLLGG